MGIHRQIAALPYRETPDGYEILLVTTRGRGRWIPPKGWPIKDLAPADTAAVEAFEEAGVVGIVSKGRLGTIQTTKIKKNGKSVPTRMDVYPLRVSHVFDRWPESHQRKRLWLPAEAAAECTDEEGFAAIIREFFLHEPHMDPHHHQTNCNPTVATTPSRP